MKTKIKLKIPKSATGIHYWFFGYDIESKEDYKIIGYKNIKLNNN